MPGAGVGWWFGESGGCSLERLGVGRPRGWTGQRLGEGAARLNERSTSAPWTLPGAPFQPVSPPLLGLSWAPWLFSWKARGSVQRAGDGLCKGPGVWGGQLPWAPQPGPSEGATRRLAPTRHRILQATFFPPP